MGAQKAQEVGNVRRMTASMCVADEVFRMGLQKIFGDYRFIYYEIKKTKDMKVDNPRETDDVCGGPMWFVPEGWPLDMLVAIRKFEFRVRILRFKNNQVWDVEALVSLDLYNHKLRSGWEAMYLNFSYNRTDCDDKKKETEFKIDRRSTPTGWWYPVLESMPGQDSLYD